MKVKCPTCGRESEWSPENKSRPFCSSRCKLIDLGAWLDERMSICEDAPSPDMGTVNRIMTGESSEGEPFVFPAGEHSGDGHGQ